MRENILVLDFGGQYNQLIARRVRDLGVYAEVVPFNKALEAIAERNPVGIILTGGPSSVYEEGAPIMDAKVFESGIPILGICYGAQLIAYLLGGTVKSAGQKEYGKAAIEISDRSTIFQGIEDSICWMSHGDSVTALPDGFKIIGSTFKCPVAAYVNDTQKIFGVQFHPEVEHTAHGNAVLKNFLYNICGAKGGWTMKNYMEVAINGIKEKVGDGTVLLALSGGVDSSVAAGLISKAIGKNLTCVFVNHGLLRKNEFEEVKEAFAGHFDMELIAVDASERFITKLQGVIDPERKRKIIGEEFIRVFEDEAKKLKSADFLAQGTIYPDVIESGFGNAALIKSHHNVGGLPEIMDFKGIIEPLRDLFKDEVRALGKELGLPEALVWRQPFPGPGLAIRIIGEVTPEKLAILKDADYIFREELEKDNYALNNVWQYFAVLTDIRSVGVMGDYRTYDYALALRAVTSSDAMSADWVRVPYEILERASNRIVNEVKFINRIVYDITSKPPATIEWE